MARSLHSQCDFENGFFSCDLPEDAVLLILKVNKNGKPHTGSRYREADREILPMENNHPKKGNNFPKNFQEF